MSLVYDVLLLSGLLGVSFGMVTIYALLAAAGRADRRAARISVTTRSARLRAMDRRMRGR